MLWVNQRVVLTFILDEVPELAFGTDRVFPLINCTTQWYDLKARVQFLQQQPTRWRHAAARRNESVIQPPLKPLLNPTPAQHLIAVVTHHGLPGGDAALGFAEFD